MCRISPTNRRGFTIIELMVVITVVTLMTSLLIGASWRFVAGSRETATATTIMKASGIIQDRVRAFREFDFTDAAMIASNNWNVAQFTAGSNDLISSDLAEVLIRKMRYKKAFPQSFLELDKSQAIRFFPSFFTSSNPYPMFPTGGSYNPKFESGIVLYALIMNGETFGAATPSPDTFTSAEIKNSPETGNLPCLVDAWGEPLRFYRWPTRLIRCGEWGFQSTDTGSAYDDYNQNLSQDPPGWVDGSSTTFSPAIRPNTIYLGPTPASLLMSNLPPFNPPLNGSAAFSSYAYGLDGNPGVAGGSAPFTTVGWPDTDDPESLNVDPDDPTFLLASWFFDPNTTASVQTTRRTNFVYGTSANYYFDAFHDFYTFQTPLFVSAGQDRQLGLYEPTDVPSTTTTGSNLNGYTGPTYGGGSSYTGNYGYLAAPKPLSSSNPLNYQCLQVMFDNISNLNQKPGGK